MSVTHSFQVAAAMEVGVNAAIILGHVAFWCEKNRANGVHLHDGLYWTYNSTRALGEIYPYMSTKAIRTAIGKLESGGYIKSGCFNDSGYDRTKWYAITAEGSALLGGSMFPKGQADVPKRADSFAQKGNSLSIDNSYLPVSDHITNVTNAKKDGPDELDDAVRQVVDHMNERLGARYRAKSTSKGSWQSMLRARLSEGYTAEDCNRVVDAKWREWHGDPKMRQYLRPSTLFAPSHFEEYLNQSEGVTVRDYSEYDVRYE